MPWPSKRRVIGTKVQRLDGPDKATGRAKYSFDIHRDGLLFGKILRCPHAHARVKSIDTSAAEKLPGCRAVHVIVKPGDELFFAGQEVLAIAADTEEHLLDCLHAVKVEYDVLPHLVKEADALNAQEGTVGGNNVQPGGEYSTAKFADQAYQNVAATTETTVGVAIISHQCLESHGLVAEWSKDKKQLTVWCSTQAVPGTASTLAGHFEKQVGLKKVDVRCITHHMGGGYGSKFGPEIQGTTAAHLAYKAGAPVHLMLDRNEEVSSAGQRPSAFGTIKAAGTKDGKIQAFEVDCYGSPGVSRGATVNFGLLPYVYVTIPNIKRRHRIVRLNAQGAKAMRAPGHPQNCLLTEQALDDLAAQLNINPMDLRLRNLPPNDADAAGQNPTSFLALRNTIYTREINIIRKMCNWDQRWHPPGNGEAGVIKTGLGMGLHTWGGAGRAPNPTKVAIHPDGSVLLTASTQDLGTGQRTVNAIVAAEVLGLNPKDITVHIGDSQFGPSTGSGGSTTTPGTSPATLNAATAAKTAFLAEIAQRLKAKAEDLILEGGHVINRSNNMKLTWRQACARLGQNPVEGTGNWTPGLSNNGVGGVQVAEVKVDTETGVVRCTNIWAVQDCGMIINLLGCESQVAGGVIMALNLALFEECIYDRNTGRMVNPDMEFYKLGGIKDIPNIHIHMMDMPERGVIGIGEPPTISGAAAIANAIFNATGVRVRQAPFTPERVLAAMANRK